LRNDLVNKEKNKRFSGFNKNGYNKLTGLSNNYLSNSENSLSSDEGHNSFTSDNSSGSEYNSNASGNNLLFGF